MQASEFAEIERQLEEVLTELRDAPDAKLQALAADGDACPVD
jgi:hypothetical protein